MKKRPLFCVLLIGFLLASVFPILARERKGPKMVLKDREVDFGEVKEGGGIRKPITGFLDSRPITLKPLRSR